MVELMVDDVDDDEDDDSNYCMLVRTGRESLCMFPPFLFYLNA